MNHTQHKITSICAENPKLEKTTSRWWRIFSLRMKNITRWRCDYFFSLCELLILAHSILWHTLDLFTYTLIQILYANPSWWLLDSVAFPQPFVPTLQHVTAIHRLYPLYWTRLSSGQDYHYTTATCFPDTNWTIKWVPSSWELEEPFTQTTGQIAHP